MSASDNFGPSNIPQTSPRQSFHTRCLKLVADRNPFYLLSAACMLAGCLALTNSLSWVSLPLGRLLLLIATINFYEAVLIGLALLLSRRNLFRDADILLVIEAFFLVDVTFLNAEVVTANIQIGILVAAVLLLLAGVKLYFAARLHLARFIYVMVQIALLLTMPCILRRLDHGSVPPITFYALWWLIGFMPAIGEMIYAIVGQRNLPRPTGPESAFMNLPFISLIAHLGILHYVYGVAFFGAMAAPLLLGLTLILKRVTSPHLGTRQQLHGLRAMLPVAAVLVSLNDPHLLTFALFSHPITPATLSIACAYLTYVYCFLLPWAIWFLGTGALLATLFLFGPSWQTVARLTGTAWSRFKDLIDRMVPATLTGWGLLSVFASFFFLLLGAAISLARPSPVIEKMDEPSA